VEVLEHKTYILNFSILAKKNAPVAAGCHRLHLFELAEQERLQICQGSSRSD